MKNTSKIFIANALRKCGHKEDYNVNFGGTVKTAAQWALRENCTKCKQKAAQDRKQRDDKAIAKAKEIMESNGFMDCSYQVINDGKMVEVNLYIKMGQ